MNKGVIAAVVVVLVGMVALVVWRKEQSEQPAPTGGAASQASTLNIAVIPKATSHTYWNSVQAGAEQAGTELGVSIHYKGPVQEDDRADQIKLVNEFVSDNVDGIVLAPLDDTALVPAVQAATAKHIPVIIIDSALKADAGKDFVCYVGTDNHAAGKMGGEQLAKLLNGKGKVILLRYLEGSASTTLREEGFLEAMKEYPNITMLVDNRYAGASVSEAEATSLNLLDQLKQADGIFCPNESTTIGMLDTLRQNNLIGKVHFVGFDATPDLVKSLKNSELDALVAQNPIKMGYQGVKSCIESIKGQQQPPIIDSGVQLITRDNLNSPDVQKLLSGG